MSAPSYVEMERRRYDAGTAAGTNRPEDALAVSEIYGPVLQGEGPHSGRPAAFVRLMGCNLSCSWCDTRYTWDPTTDLRGNTTHMPAHEILDAAIATRAPLMVLTGGEPLLQQNRPAFARLVGGAHEHGMDVHVETNGTVEPGLLVGTLVDAIAVSPKGANAGDHRGRQDPAIHPVWLAMAQHRHNVFFKLVVETPDEVREWTRDLTAAGVPRARLWFMPQGRTAAEITARWPAIVEAAAAELVNACTRTHVLAFGTERGR